MGTQTNVVGLECTLCGARYEATPDMYTCPHCGETGILDVLYDYDRVKTTMTRETLAADRNLTMWRYGPLLPCAASTPRPNLRVGWTPLYREDRYAATIGLKKVFVKDDGLNPTASLKDRASAMGVVKAQEAGAKAIACSSTGNAGSSLAGNATAAGLKSYIFVPERAPQGKLAQLLLFGATVISVKGNYEDAFSLSAEAIRHWGWYNRNAALNPYLMEGKKTVSLEIAEQLGWKAPDWVVVSVGDGCTVAGVGKGFFELHACGLIDRVPRILGVQAEGCAPLYRAFKAGKEEFIPEPEETLADSIAVGVPRNPVKALRAIRRAHGEMITVSDQEILEAIRLLGSTAGIFAEPAAAAGFAGLAKASRTGLIAAEEVVVGIVTGNGLKDVASGLKAAGEPIRIPPDLNELARILEEGGKVR
ncbi:MAG TPA: threonine synthase [Firmicutes bacterium]|nr:threonine synthase [Bacillota bacterium]